MGGFHMKKALLINGSPHREGCTFTALAELQKALDGAGVAGDLLWLGTKPMQDCTSCGRCEATGLCVFGDQVNEVLDQLDDYGAIVVGSPVYYSGATGRLCSFLDRLFYAGGDRMAGKLGAAVVSCRRGGSTASFERLNQYFLISNMFVVGSQYWNQVHSFTPDDVRQDAEGLQTMRTLGVNMAWMLRSIEAGQKAGIPAPAYEEHVWTHFIG